MIIHNHTGLLIEDKVEQLNLCLRKKFRGIAFELDAFECTRLVDGSVNFTTSGIYHLRGTIETGSEHRQWSIVIKIIKRDSEEKDHNQHHNYWRREAFIFESNLLDASLPEIIETPEPYLAEEQRDGTIWLWMEYVQGETPSTQEHFNRIAYQLGEFNAPYLTGRSLPSEPWICNNWLRSWTASSQIYAPDPQSFINRLEDREIRNSWEWFLGFTVDLNDKLESLSGLPRVLAHQDLSYKNMIINSTSNRLVLMDWQFLSISGIGEDLGKMAGVNMSLGPITIAEYDSFCRSIFRSYIQGMRESGWQGDEELARYGYGLSMAMRSVWEVPQLCSLAAQLEKDPLNDWMMHRVELLKQINAIHQVMAEESAKLRGKLDLLIG
ncbi:phosphotransferase [Paenibacillus glycanilyticus]|uniref:phosphotransferase n=1 Tax=Paenibacillus glycanilyticus TaxID=126569 RepID=UPI002040A0D5|nr:phosphotransferase [Paenibacillus glycanilyticus]MCM3628667.1 phosphotransferase [Paenibacillus glycanilyticus]